MTKTHPDAGQCPVSHLTTAFGAPVPDNQDSLTAGPRGPLLAQDVWLNEKLANFVREVIPERRMHAKGSGAFGTFTVTNDITRYTRAPTCAAPPTIGISGRCCPRPSTR